MSTTKKSSENTSLDTFCYIKDELLVYKPLKVKMNTPDSLKITVIDKDIEVVLNKADIIPILSSDDLIAPPNDLVHLSEVNNASILHSLRERFYKDLIYTSIGSILVAINPFKWINNLYHESLMARYASHEYTLGSNPHVFAIAQKALEGTFLLTKSLFQHNELIT
jgi:myosin heavy subunit